MDSQQPAGSPFVRGRHISISAFYSLPLFAPFWDWRKSQQQKCHKQKSQVKIPTSWSIPKLDFALALSRCNLSCKL